MKRKLLFRCSWVIQAVEIVWESHWARLVTVCLRFVGWVIHSPLLFNFVCLKLRALTHESDTSLQLIHCFNSTCTMTNSPSNFTTVNCPIMKPCRPIITDKDWRLETLTHIQDEIYEVTVLSRLVTTWEHLLGSGNLGKVTTELLSKKLWALQHTRAHTL